MVIRLNINAYIRILDRYVLIKNQLSQRSEIFDEIGGVFLQHINRNCQHVNEIVSQICNHFSESDLEEITKDFLKFVEHLEASGFLVSGNNISEVNTKEENQIIKSKLSNKWHPSTSENTQLTIRSVNDFLYSEFKNNPYLQSIQIELTSSCNEKCVHCYVPTLTKTFLPKGSIFRLLDQASSIGVLEVAFSGGEALIHPDIVEILKYARKKDFIIKLLTNLTLLNNKFVDVILSENIAEVQVSLYSMDNEEHDKITRVKGSFKKTFSNIKKLNSLKVPVKIGCPIMEVNKTGFVGVMNWCYEMNIPFSTDYTLFCDSDFTQTNLEALASPSDIKVAIEKTKDFAVLKKLDGLKNPYENKSSVSSKNKDYLNQPVCTVGINNICVTSEGFYVPCPSWREFKLGNIDTDNLVDVWTSSDKLNMIRNVTNSDFMDCMGCDSLKYCGICMARNYNESGGSIFKIQQRFCDTANSFKDVYSE